MIVPFSVRINRSPNRNPKEKINRNRKIGQNAIVR